MKTTFFYSTLCLLLAGLVVSSAQAVLTAPINFSFTVNQPSCVVTPSVAGTLEWNDIDPDEIAENSNSQVKNFTLTLGCAGISSFGQKPTLTLTGTTLAQGMGNYSNDSYKYLFNDNSTGAGAANYVGFNLCVDYPTNHCNSGTDIYVYSQANGDTVALTANAGEAAPGSVTVYVQPSIGRYTTPMVTGELHASVTFEVAYQ